MGRWLRIFWRFLTGWLYCAVAVSFIVSLPLTLAWLFLCPPFLAPYLDPIIGHPRFYWGFSFAFAFLMGATVGFGRPHLRPEPPTSEFLDRGAGENP